MNSIFENRGNSGYTSTAKPCGHNNLSHSSLGFSEKDLAIMPKMTGKEYKVCYTCNTMHRRWWWQGKPNGWVSLVR